MPTFRRVKAWMIVVATAALVAAACNSFSSNDDPSAGGDAGSDSATAGDSPSPDADGGPTTCGDTTGDPKNCGKCGHDCLGGSCSAATCQPFTLATTSEPIPFLALDATRVIWLTSLPQKASFGTLYACPKATGCGSAGPTPLKSSFKGGTLGSDGTTAYFSDVQFASLGVVTPTGGTQTLPGPPKSNIFWITPRDGGLLVNAFYEADGSPFSRSIYRAEINAGGFQAQASYDSLDANTDWTVFTKTHVYLGAHNKPLIVAAALGNNGVFQEVTSAPTAYVASMTTDGDRVYFTNDGPVYSCAGDGQPCTLTEDLTPSSAFAGAPQVVLAADGRLFIETTGGDLLACNPSAGCASTLEKGLHETKFATEWLLTGQNIAVDAKAIYYVAREDGVDGGFSYLVKGVAR